MQFPTSRHRCDIFWRNSGGIAPEIQRACLVAVQCPRLALADIHEIICGEAERDSDYDTSSALPGEKVKVRRRLSRLCVVRERQTSRLGKRWPRRRHLT